MTKLAHESLLQCGVDAVDSGSFQDSIISISVLPGDVHNAFEAAYVEGIELPFLSGVQSLGLTAIQEGAHDACSVHLVCFISLLLDHTLLVSLDILCRCTCLAC